MATIKDIRRRIRSVASTQQITRAMEMVAAAKLRRAQERVVSARPYAAKMTEVLENLAAATAGSEVKNLLFEVRPVRRRTLVVIASDKGLCGAFNASIFRAAEADLKGADRREVDLVPVGKRAANTLGRRGWRGTYGISELGDTLDIAKAQALARHLITSYVEGKTDRVDFLYTRFISVGSRKIVHETFLPIVPAAGERQGPAKDYIFEPSPETIFDDLLPRYVRTRVLAAMGESLASEQAARLVSMSAATKNAGEMIQSLTLIRNKLRQAAITKEISELVGGAEAQK